MEWFNYLLKVSACSAFFFAFYLLVLRKLTFFKINRFYLLFTLLLGFVIPTLQFTVERELAAAPIIEAPVVVQNEDLTEQFSLPPTTAPVVSLPVEEAYNWFNLLPFLYITVVFGLLGLATWRLLQLIKHAKQNTQEINGLKLVHKSNGFTNCSFFNYVFIDENSLTENELQIMLRHEEVHAKQYHSVDKIILIIVKAVLWFNPIVYLYDKALEQIHEYEADEVTSRNFGTASYANLLLRLAVIKSDMLLVHNFVKSPIKARIKMLFNSKSKHMKKLLYLLALPIGMGLLWGFTVDVVDVIPKAKPEKEFTLILDAGHGGKLNGVEVNGHKEKDIALAFAKKIKALAEAKGIKVVTTRDNDENVSLQDRVKVKGDYLLSIHVNSEPIVNDNGTRNGIEIYTPTSDRGLIWTKSNSMQHYLYEQLKSVVGIRTASKPVQQRLLLLQNSSAAGVLIEMGYLTNQQDLKTITNETKQNELAAAIVKGIVLYKDKTPGDETVDQNYKAAISPINSAVQNQPFVQRINAKTAGGYNSEQILLNTVSGSPISIKTIYNISKYQKPMLWVYVNHKLYSEEEAQKFNQDFIAKLPLKRGYSFATDFNIPAMGDEKNAYVFWFGNEPKLSDYTAKNRAYWEKYNGKTVEGKVIGYTFSPTSKVVDGFLVKTTNGETLKANVEAKFATQTQAMIGKNDQVSIKIYNSNYRKDTQYPVLTSYKISKGGKLLYDRWPKITTNTKPTNDETLNVAQNQQAKILSKPILLSSTRMTVDNKNEISYVKNGVMKIYGGELLADELTFDQKNKKVITKKATFTDKAGKVMTGDMFTFDYEKGTYDVKAASGNSYPVNKKAGLINLDPIKYTATDSIITNKLTGDVFLYGNVKLLNNNQTYQSDRMVYNKVKQTLKVRDNLQMYDKMSNTYTKADSLYMNLKTGKGIFYRKTLLKFDR